jgi:hypothetical protein
MGEGVIKKYAGNESPNQHLPYGGQPYKNESINSENHFYKSYSKD